MIFSSRDILLKIQDWQIMMGSLFFIIDYCSVLKGNIQLVITSISYHASPSKSFPTDFISASMNGALLFFAIPFFWNKQSLFLLS